MLGEVKVKPKTWKLYRLSCYLLLVGSGFWLIRFGYSTYLYPSLFSWIRFLIYVVSLSVVGWFQVVNLDFLEERVVDEELSGKLDSRVYYLLLRGSFVVLILYLVMDCGIIIGMALIRKYGGFNWTNFVANIGVFIFTLILCYNLISSIGYKKYLVLQVQKRQQAFIDELGINL